MGKNKVRFLKLGFIIFIVFARRIDSTDAFFSATAVSEGNTITAGTVGFGGGGDTPPPAYSKGDVVINEVMWMGADGNSYDEWIELKNTTGSSIELTGWTIEKAGLGSDSITIQGEKFIPAGGYFLIAHYSSVESAIKDSIAVDLVKPGISLKNNGEELILKDSHGTVIDQTLSDKWVAGENDTGTDPPTRKSMERNENPGSGWHTCESADCADAREIFWDSVGNNYGTPKAVNLSKNDPSSADYIPEEDNVFSDEEIENKKEEIVKDEESINDTDVEEKSDEV